MKKFILLVLLFCSAVDGHSQFSLKKLQVNYQTTPLGTDLARPQFSWQMKATLPKRGLSQKVYRITVSDEKGQQVWDSKKVFSDIAHGIQYEGLPLQPTTRYTWKLTLWDNTGITATASSWFETGMLHTGIAAWSGAKWIGGGNEDLVLYSPYLSVFKLEFALALDANSKSTKASFLFGANDSRLENKYLNLMGVEKKKKEGYVALELDISGLGDGPDSTARLNIYRVGYTPTDKVNIPFKSLAIPKDIINPGNKYEKHRILAACNFGMFEFYVDGSDLSHKLKDKGAANPSPYAPVGINLNPVGSGNNYISFPMLADIGIRTDSGQTAFFSGIEIRNFRYPGNALFTENLAAGKGIFSLPVEKGAYRASGNTLVTADPSRNAAPMLRNVFRTEAKPIKKARLYVTARGIYEMYLNGHRVGNDYFNPGLTQYNKNHMYQTYDITAQLKSGQPNAVGAWLSEGWWSGNITYSGENWNFFGDRQSLLAKVLITYEDGTEQLVTSGDRGWKLFTGGPVRYGSFFQGEVYDATKEDAIKGWSTAAYDDKAWKPAVEVPLEGTSFVGTVTDDAGRKSALPYDDFKLTGQMGENAGMVKTLTARSVEEVRPKVYVYDMGQNMVGFPQIMVKAGKRGQVINLRYAEIRYPALSEYKGHEGMVMMENIRAALTQDQYLLKGGDEIIQPRFTFHGYRYLEITGVDHALPVSDVKGLVISSINELASSFETNDPLVNKLWQNITWSLRSNFLSIPTDTPARNERMGWSGDISVFSKSATYLADVNLFLRRHLLAMRDVQPESGRFTDVAPMGGGFGGTLWGSAGIVVAWETYRQYGDVQVLSEHYEAMKKYIAFLETKIDANTGILNEGPLGDWLSPEGNKNDNTLFWMAYFAYDLELMSRMAAVLGKTEEAMQMKNRSGEIKKAFNELYVDKVSHKTVKSGLRTGFMGPPNTTQGAVVSDKGQLIDTQASYAIPLALEVFDELNKPFAIAHLREAISRKNTDDQGVQRPEYALMTGFIGTASISEALSAYGSDDLAYQLLVNKQYPSWLYSVVNGATSIWERLNSFTVENGFGGNNSMNSFNHYSFGAVAAWMYNYSLGIQRHPLKAGFKEFVLQPTPDPGGHITSAKGYYDSMYGRISSEWSTKTGKLVYKATVPANSSATLYLPAKELSHVLESGKPISSWKGVRMENDRVLIPLSSGTYSFEVK